MATNARKLENCTYGDYLTWPEEERWEIIEGVPYDMSPGPSIRHQRISRNLFRQIDQFLLGRECEALYAPFDVRLPQTDESDQNVTTVVQPDISVICDPAKIDDRGCRGAPDFIVEILSPHTSKKDQAEKLALYEKHGVKEYWIIYPDYATVIVRLLGQDGKYGPPEIHETNGSLEVATLPDLAIDLDVVFERREGETW
ncbi:MAG: Uma2 family endonuclease [Deltaproteobacteria bacterium]|nr:Uma2 family endonuclease [Deltaproteobacteria bacterium]